MHVEIRPEETSALARLMPGARLVEVRGCDVAADPARAREHVPATDWRDAVAGLGGVGVMVAAAATPFLRVRRGAWDARAGAAGGPYPGDERIPEPRWGWTHEIEIAARRTRLVSRYRLAGSHDLRTRLTMGSTLMEPIGFAMDHRMVRGIRNRAERAVASGSAGSTAR